MSSFITTSQTFNEAGLNPGHDLPTVDKTEQFTSGLSNDIEPGVLLKVGTSGNLEPWVQGTDATSDIVGVYAGASPLDTTTRTTGVIRIFGPITAEELISWTAADGSTTADPTADALDALEQNAPSVFPVETTTNAT